MKDILRTARQAQARIQMAEGIGSVLPDIVRSLPIAAEDEAMRTALVNEMLDLGQQINACQRRVGAVIARLESLPIENRMILPVNVETRRRRRQAPGAWPATPSPEGMYGDVRA